MSDSARRIALPILLGIGVEWFGAKGVGRRMSSVDDPYVYEIAASITLSLSLIAVALVTFGCSQFAESRGRSRWWGLLGNLCVCVPYLLILIPDRRGRQFPPLTVASFVPSVVLPAVIVALVIVDKVEGRDPYAPTDWTETHLAWTETRVAFDEFVVSLKDASTAMLSAVGSSNASGEPTGDVERGRYSPTGESPDHRRSFDRLAGSPP